MLERISYNHRNECWEKTHNKTNFGIKVMKFPRIPGVACVCEPNNRELKKHVFLATSVDWNKMVSFTSAANVLPSVKTSHGLENQKLAIRGNSRRT